MTRANAEKVARFLNRTLGIAAFVVTDSTGRFAAVQRPAEGDTVVLEVPAAPRPASHGRFEAAAAARP